MRSKAKKRALMSGEIITTTTYLNGTYNLYIEDDIKFYIWNWMIFNPIWVYPFWVWCISASGNIKIRKFQILTIFQKFKNQKFLVVNNSDLIRWPKSDMTTEYRCRSVSGNVRGGSLIFRILDLEKNKSKPDEPDTKWSLAAPRGPMWYHATYRGQIWPMR